VTHVNRYPVTSTIDEGIIARVRSEYHEMPGLRLTVAQAARLWQLDRLECEAVLDFLVRQRLLARTADGAFVRPE
jgi:hypothetical protein